MSRPSSAARVWGRIGGIVGSRAPGSAHLLAGPLGPGAQILGEQPDAVAADFDACWLQGRLLQSIDDWRAVIRAGRLDAVAGAFAVAWREADGAVCLARDAIGERSLFYASIPGGLIFASTLQAIAATGLIPLDIDPAAVARYLTYAYLPGPQTLIRGLRKLLPGEMLSLRGGALISARLWSVPAEPEPGAAMAEGELRVELRRRLEAAVLRRLPAAGPVGASLSGGVDSSLVVALARQLRGGDIHTYSVSFGPQYPNELEFSSLVAAHCGTRHRIVEFSPAAIRQNLDPCLAALSDPIGDPLTVPNYLLFREAGRDVGVVLNGEGGDPSFGGPKNVPMLLAELLGDGADVHGHEAEAAAAYGRERSYLRAHQKCFDDLSDMLRPDARAAIAAHALESEVAPLFRDPRWPSFIAKLMAINTAFKAPFHILHKVDAVSAPAGVVARSPLFDRDVVELAFAIPPRLKLRGSIEKYLLKEAIRDILPAAIVERRKSGMLVPVEGWYKGPLLEDARERLLDGLSQWGLFQRPYLERLLDGRIGGLRPRRGVKIWLLVTLESWLRSVRRADRPPRT